MTSRPAFLLLLAPLVLATIPLAAAPIDPTERGRLAERVKAQVLHAWKGYEAYAWGHDELTPLSRAARDWYADPLLVMPVDSLDTLLLLGLRDEARRAQDLIVEKLSFAREFEVKAFEINIRLLGGLLSSYQMTGDPKLLALAEDLGDRLLKAFDSPTGMPYTFVNLKTGKTSGPETNPAEIGTYILELGTLSRLTGRPVYYLTAKKALSALFERRSHIGLVGEAINVETGAWTSRTSHVGACIDSYYESLLKGFRLFGDAELKRMWDVHAEAIRKYVLDDVRGELWSGHVDMETGQRTARVYGALDAFLPALLVLAGDLDRARRLQDSGMKMWRLHGIEPDGLDYGSMTVLEGAYPLRPEIMESAYYLYRRTQDPAYLEMGRELLDGLVTHCRTDVGFAGLKDVRTKEKVDRMQSFVVAETFKYLWLLFAPDDAFDFEGHIFTTEAHPLKRVAWSPLATSTSH